MSVWEQVYNERQCAHPQTELRYKTASNGVISYWTQCLTCGEGTRCWRRALLSDKQISRARPFDYQIKQEYAEETRRQAQARIEVEKEARTTDWWQRYTSYLNSWRWQVKRQKVLERDSFVCQSCLAARATQVHHLTYDHLFNEPLFDLVSICDACHARVTEQDRKRRGEAA